MEEIHRRVKLTDGVKVQTLSVLDQVRIILSQFSNEDVSELKAQEQANTANLKTVASLNTFIDNATAKIISGEVDCVTVALSPKYIKVFPQVFDKVTGKGRYFNFTVVQDKTQTIRKDKRVLVRIRRVH